MRYIFDICDEYSNTIKKVDIEAPDISSAFLQLIINHGITNKTTSIYIEKKMTNEDEDDF